MARHPARRAGQGNPIDRSATNALRKTVGDHPGRGGADIDHGGVRVNAEAAVRSHTVAGSARDPDRGPDPEDWTAAAACKGRTHLFFGSAGERPERRVRREARARKVCGSCPALWPCRLSARANRENGFWGGESEEERASAGYPPRSISRRSVHAANVGPVETPVEIRATAC